MAAVARIGDTSNHGGSIISGSPNVFVNGAAVARNGDTLACPFHGFHAINAITTKTRVNGQLVLTVGAVATCGAVITSGSPNVDVE